MISQTCSRYNSHTQTEFEEFFVHYLTVNGPTELDQVPGSVMEAMMASTENQSDLVTLSCKNVVMPTAMSTIHQQFELQENSRKTAGRGSEDFVGASNPIHRLEKMPRRSKQRSQGMKYLLRTCFLVEVNCLHVE